VDKTIQTVIIDTMIFGITRKLYPKALYISSSRTAWTAPCII